MRAWKIHLSWALIAMSASGAWGRWCVSRQEAVSREREVAGRFPSPSPGVVPPAAPVPSVAAPPSPAGPIGSVRLPADFHLLPDLNNIPLDEVRRLMKSTGIRDLWRALSGIDRLPNPALRRELLVELLHCPQEQIRQMVMVRLALMGDEDAVPPLQEALRTDPQPYLRALAAEHLGKLPDRGTVALLLSAYRDGDDDMKLTAAASLYRFGHPGEVSELLPRLAANLDSPDGSVRKEAIESLAKLKVPVAIPLLTRGLTDTNGDVRSEAASALGDLDDPGIPILLEPLLHDPLSDVRENAKDALETYRERHPE